MSKSSAPFLRLAPKPSRLFAGAVAFVHGTAAIACLANDLPVLLRVALAVTVLLAFVHTRKAFVVDAGSVEVTHTTEGVWRIALPAADETAVTLLPSTVVTTWVAILHFVEEAGIRRFQVIVFRDSVDADSFRRLRVLLRCLPAVVKPREGAEGHRGG